jgi:hypothetical protein
LCDASRERVADEVLETGSQFIKAAIEGLITGHSRKPLLPVLTHVLIDAPLLRKAL